MTGVGQNIFYYVRLNLRSSHNIEQRTRAEIGGGLELVLMAVRCKFARLALSE